MEEEFVGGGKAARWWWSKVIKNRGKRKIIKRPRRDTRSKDDKLRSKRKDICWRGKTERRSDVEEKDKT